MDDRYEIEKALFEAVGEEGCGTTTCDDADIIFDEEGWKLMMCAFMEPWKLGKTVDEAKATIRELGSMHYGLS